MAADPKGCHHQLSRPPALVREVKGTLYLVFECLLCSCEIVRVLERAPSRAWTILSAELSRLEGCRISWA